MTTLLIAGILLLCYLVGAFPTGLIVARQWAGIDIREHGSRNIGATNVYRVLGAKAGLLTFAIDVLRGLVMVLLIPWIAGGGPHWLPVIGGLCVLAGNFFNVFLGFKGGKGVATSLGVFLALAPMAMLVDFALFVVLLALFGYVSLASIIAAAALPVLVYTLQGGGLLFWVILVVSVLVIAKHRANIGRLLAGTESKFRFRRSAAT